MRAFAHDVGLHPDFLAAAVTRPSFGRGDELSADAATARAFVNDQAFEQRPVSLDKRRLGADGDPPDNAIRQRRDQNSAPFAALQPIRVRIGGYVVAELTRKRGDPFRVFGAGRTYLRVYGESVSRCTAARCTAASLKGNGNSRPAIHSAASSV